PMAVLVGVLIGLGRMSADSELIALSALGMGLRRVLVPVGVLACGTGLVTLAITVWLGPAALRTLRQVQDQLVASQASFQVQPRVFDERFPHMVLYVEDLTAAATHWRGVFLAETGSDKTSQLTLAEDAIVIAGRQQGKLELHLLNGSTHEFAPREPDHYAVSTFAETDWPVDLGGTAPERSGQLSNPERTTSELLSAHGPNTAEAKVELQRRFAFPVACLVFALLAVPLSARPRRGGRAMGFLVTLTLVCGYYLIFVIGAGFARQGRISPVLGIWAANFLTGIAGIALIPGMERIRGESWMTRMSHRLTVRYRNWRGAKRASPDAQAGAPDPGVKAPIPI
ncbi:MAG: LptF/LptG family permease, partial [Bryobacteraceae bacterium]